MPASLTRISAHPGRSLGKDFSDGLSFLLAT
jgi:hypothetical protein